MVFFVRLPQWLTSKESASCNTGDMAGGTGSTPGSERSPGEETQPSIPAWKTPWTQEPCGL